MTTNQLLPASGHRIQRLYIVELTGFLKIVGHAEMNKYTDLPKR
ncbi:hypothetical protein [Sporosarcina sp. BP05]|nr:hypothetical protein [Sporosarcina sp. BP05]